MNNLLIYIKHSPSNLYKYKGLTLSFNPGDVNTYFMRMIGISIYDYLDMFYVNSIKKHKLLSLNKCLP